MIYSIPHRVLRGLTIPLVEIDIDPGPFSVISDSDWKSAIDQNVSFTRLGLYVGSLFETDKSLLYECTDITVPFSSKKRKNNTAIISLKKIGITGIVILRLL